MSTKDEAVSGFIGTVVGLGVIRICQWLYEIVSIFLVFHVVILKASENVFVISLGFDARLRIVRRSGEMFYTKQGA